MTDTTKPSARLRDAERIVLTPDPTTPTIVGRDADGLGWLYLDAGAFRLRCPTCGNVIRYWGFISADGRQKRCRGCAEVRRD